MQPPWRYRNFPALEYLNFRYFIVGQTINLAGTRLHEVGAGWLMWELTGSAVWVGALAAAEMAPRLLLWPIAGSLADRLDRRRLAIVFQSLSAAGAVCLTLLSWAGVVEIYSLLALTAFFGVTSAFWQPTRHAILPRLVSRSAMASAVALSSVSGNLARVVGPLIAGPVLLWGSITLVFALNSVSFFAVVFAFWLMDLPQERARKDRSKVSIREVSQGFAVILHDPGVRTMIVFVAIFALCVRPASDLLPVFAEGVFGAGPVGLAALTSAMGCGSLFSGLVMSVRQRTGGLTTTLALAGALAAIMTASMAVAWNLPLAMVCIAIMGFGVTLENIVAQILLQLALADDVRGRVLSVYSMLFTSAPGLGALGMGWLGDLFGITVPVVAGAAVGLVASLAIFARRHRLAILLVPPQENSNIA